ncbi:hypothetical protein [Pseudochrobactrum sp. B5]|uniref:hypothetical protein n=1 Tax=Pseudochrobactrum sp. B5 TaxID=1289478 RepID=UPI0009535C74|nr:hypothetical protein [Pseudochrobactrum sp. B5]
MNMHKFYIKTNADGLLTGVFDTIYYEPSAEQIEGFTEVDQPTFEELYQNQQTRRYVNGKVEIFMPTPLTPEEQRAQMPPISKRQLRLTLVRNGISLSDLDAAILAMGDEATIEWQDASEYRRLHPLLNQVAAHLSLKQEQVDAMWQQALTA